MTKKDLHILLLYGHHRGTTAEYIEKELSRLCRISSAGISAGISAGSNTDNPFTIPCTSPTPAIESILQSFEANNRPDAIVQIECGTVLFFPTGLERVDIPKFFYAIDPHFNWDWHRLYVQLFDMIFVSFEQFCAQYRSVHPRVAHIAHAFDQDVYREFPQPRDLDIVFVGHVDPVNRPKRSRLLAALQKHFSVTVVSGVWKEDVARLYSRAKIVFNENDHDVLNPRNFEAMACGAALLTNGAVGLADLFVDRTHCIVYKDEYDIVEIARYYLMDESSRRIMALAGQQLVLLNHSWRLRIKLIYDQIRSFVDEKPRTTPPVDTYGAAIYKNIGLVYYNRGFLPQAIEFLRRFAEDNQTDSENWYYIGWLWAQMNNGAEAMVNYQQAIRCDPNCRNAYLELGQVYMDKWQWADADALFLSFPAIASDDEMLLLRCCCMMPLGKKNEARAIIEKIIARDPQNGHARNLLNKIQSTI